MKKSGSQEVGFTMFMWVVFYTSFINDNISVQ